MNSLSRLTLVFGLLFAVLIISPAFLNGQFALFPLLKYGDFTDVLTPLVLIPLYWLLFHSVSPNAPTQRENLVFLIFAALWVEGHGMHLSSNSIGHLLGNLKNTDAYALTHFFDEVLSHYLWHLGIVGLSALIIFRQWQYFFGESSLLTLESLAGFIYGTTFWITSIEAGTVPLGLPFAFGAALLIFISRRGTLRQQPLLAFFLVAYGLATILFAGWGIYWRGFPQFSEIGIIE